MIRLHDYWRSGAAYRVRIALHLKGIAYDIAAHDLRCGDQRAPDYLAVNPQGLVPALDTGTATLTQSLAILEWLDERYPAVPLLPADAESRAIVRGMAQIVCCDIHPLNNLRVLTALRRDLGASEEQVEAWIGRWIGEGFAALEVLIARHGGAYAFGDQSGEDVVDGDGLASDLKCATHDPVEGHRYQQHAGQPKLFADHGQQKIGVCFRQVMQFFYAAAQTDAE